MVCGAVRCIASSKIWASHKAFLRFFNLPLQIENGVNAIQKWILFTPKCSEERWRLGRSPRPPSSEVKGLRRLPVWHAEGKGRRFPSSPRAPETLGTPLIGYIIPFPPEVVFL